MAATATRARSSGDDSRAKVAQRFGVDPDELDSRTPATDDDNSRSSAGDDGTRRQGPDDGTRPRDPRDGSKRKAKKPAAKKAVAKARGKIKPSARRKRDLRKGVRSVAQPAANSLGSGTQVIGAMVGLTLLYLLMTNADQAAGVLGLVNKGLVWLRDPNRSIPYKP